MVSISRASKPALRWFGHPTEAMIRRCLISAVRPATALVPIPTTQARSRLGARVETDDTGSSAGGHAPECVDAMDRGSRLSRLIVRVIEETVARRDGLSSDMACGRGHRPRPIEGRPYEGCHRGPQGDASPKRTGRVPATDHPSPRGPTGVDTGTITSSEAKSQRICSFSIDDEGTPYRAHRAWAPHAFHGPDDARPFLRMIRPSSTASLRGWVYAPSRTDCVRACRIFDTSSGVRFISLAS